MNMFAVEIISGVAMGVLGTALGIFVFKVYEEASGRRASNKVVADLKEGIQLTHNKLEAEGTLKK